MSTAWSATEDRGRVDRQGSALLLQDVAYAEHAVEHLVTVPFKQDRYDALVSFTYNEGAGRLQSETLLNVLNAGNYAGAAGQFGDGCTAVA